MTAWNSAVLSRDQQFAAKRQAVLREAARAFRSKGYHQTSLEDVARALNVTKPALYYYFKSKEEILFQCHMLSLDLGERAMKEARAKKQANRDMLARFLGRYIELIAGELGDLAMLSEVDALTGDYRREVLRRRRQFDRRFRELIARGVADGSIRQVDPKLAVFFFMGAVQTLTRWYDPEGPLAGPDVAEAFVDLLLEGLRPRSRSGA
jgi:AcrR family transcriptional regulator